MTNIDILNDIARNPLGLTRSEIQGKFFDGSRYKADGYIVWLLTNKMVNKVGHQYMATMNLINYLDVLLKTPVVEMVEENTDIRKTRAKVEQNTSKTQTKLNIKENITTQNNEQLGKTEQLKNPEQTKKVVVSIMENIEKADFSKIGDIVEPEKKKYWNGYLCENPATKEFKDRNKKVTEMSLKCTFFEDCKYCLPNLDDSVIKEFGAYWFEPLKSGKYKFQGERAFELCRRLNTWVSNNYGNNKKESTLVHLPKIIKEF